LIFPKQGVVFENVAGFPGDRGRRNGGELIANIRFPERFERDAQAFEAAENFQEGSFVPCATQNHGGFNAVPHVHAGHLPGGMNGLDDLLGEGEVSADEVVAVIAVIFVLSKAGHGLFLSKIHSAGYSKEV
jgi:hypothetical protein